MQQWTADQWAAFCGVTAAGLAAVALLGLAVRTVRGWTAPAHAYLAPRPALRPTVQLAARRAPAWAIEAYGVPLTEAIARTHLAAARQRALTAATTPDLPAADIAVLAHLAEGPGSLASLAAVGEGSLVRVELVDRETRDAFAFAFDRPAHTPTRDEAGIIDDGGVLTRFHAAIEASMRKARLWEIQGRGVAGHDSARQALDHWRIDTPTGEYPLVVLADARMAGASA